MITGHRTEAHSRVLARGLDLGVHLGRPKTFPRTPRRIANMSRMPRRPEAKPQAFTLCYEGKKDEAEILRRMGPRPLSLRDITPGGTSGEEAQERPGRYFLGDNADVLRHLLSEEDVRGRVQLVYIDPPYGTGQVFTMDRKRGRAHSVSQPEEGDLGYSDTLTGPAFIEFLRERLVLLRELLSQEGLIFVHLDEKHGFEAKIILDEIFGRENFVNHISRIGSNPKNFSRKAFGNQKDMILVYAKSGGYYWDEVGVPYTEEDLRRLFPFVDENGRRYTTNPLHAPGETKDGPTGQPWRGIPPPPGRHWRYPPEVLEELDRRELIVWTKGGVPRKKVYADERAGKGKKPQDIWEFKDPQNPLYPTEKNLDMLKLIVATASRPGDLVLDAFAGSGTALIAAVSLGRRAIGIDSSKEALDAFWLKANKHGLASRFRLLDASH
jgi:adenine-specific DNA-methyltransferase